jgi:hypothetical protein
MYGWPMSWPEGEGFFQAIDVITDDILFTWRWARALRHDFRQVGEAGLGSRRDGGDRGRRGRKIGAQAGMAASGVEKPMVGRRERQGPHTPCSAQLSPSGISNVSITIWAETVQNLLYLRFANSVFEPIWNRHHIEAIDISVFETVGIGDRGGYYDSAGAARDMLQNHLIQLMCLTTMEPPASLDPENIHNEKVKVLQSIAPYSPASLLARALRGQYVRGVDAEGRSLPDYREETRVKPDSSTETYVALTLELDNWRFAGVPFRLRTGKAFRVQVQPIVYILKTPCALFTAQCGVSLLQQHPDYPNPAERRGLASLQR